MTPGEKRILQLILEMIEDLASRPHRITGSRINAIRRMIEEE